jgi:hypothetical protein
VCLVSRIQLMPCCVSVQTTVYRKDPTSGVMIASDIFRCGEEGCNKTFKTRGGLSTHQGHHKRVRNPKRSRVEVAAQQTDVSEANSNSSHPLAMTATTDVDKAPVPPPPFAQHPAAVVMATQAVPAAGTIAKPTAIGIVGNPVASYNQTGSPAQSSQTIRLHLTPTAPAAAYSHSVSGDVYTNIWGSANASQHHYGAGQWARVKAETGNCNVSNCDEVAACFPTSPLVAPPPHISVPLTGPDDGTSQPRWDRI